MKKTITLTLTAFLLIGCGGGGGGPSVPHQPTGGTNPSTETNTTETNTTGGSSSGTDGGSSSGTGGGGGVTVTSPQAGVDYTDPAQFTQTSTISDQLSRTNAQVAYNNGFTGGNISLTQSYTKVSTDTSNRNLQTIIAILDSGINSTHEDFNTTNKIIGFKDFTATNSSTPYDDVGHGTMVASIAAGNKNSNSDQYYGMAYGADLLIGQIISNDTTDNVTLQTAINWVIQQKQLLDVANVQQVTALNLSLGTNSSAFVNNSFLTTLRTAISSGLNIVVASGNEGLDCKPSNGSIDGRCSFPAASPWVSGSADSTLLNGNGGWIVVGSVDANNVISSFSNKAGVTMSNYIVAPGENIIGASSTNNNGYMIGTGTSFATPLVAGAMSLMAQKWGYLTGRQQAQILFDTATDLGAPGIDDVYGNGLLNLTAAFNPVGTVVIPTGTINVLSGTKPTQIYKKSTMVTSSALANLSSFEPLNNTIGIDNYNRDFKLNFTNNFASTGESPIDFDNFLTFDYDNVFFGIDERNNKLLIGYKPSKTTRLKLSVDNTFLGSSSDGALNLSNSRSLYIGMDHNIYNEDELSLDLSLFGAYGTTEKEDNSLISSISDVYAVGGKISTKYKGFGVGYEIPLRTISGNISFNIPTGITNDGSIMYSQYNSSLNPKSFQQIYSLFYEKKINNFSLYSKLSKTYDAFGVSNLVNNQAELLVNYYF